MLHAGLDLSRKRLDFCLLDERRPPDVHRATRGAFARSGNRVAVRLCGLAGRCPPNVHGPLERKRVHERDGVLVAVDGEVAVVEVD